MNNKRLLTVDEASQYLGLGKQTLYNMASEKRIPFVKIGRSVRFDVKDIDVLIEQWKVEVANNEKL